MPKLPFIISDTAWNSLKPRQIDELGRDKELDPEQQKFLEIFRTVDLRVEWVCQRMVFINNAVVVLGFIFTVFVIMTLRSPKTWDYILSLIP